MVSLVLAVIPVIALILYSAWEERSRATLEAKQQTRKTAFVIADQQRHVIVETHNMLSELATLPEIREPDTQGACQQTLLHIQRQNPLYGNIIVVDTKGDLLCSGIAFEKPINFSDRIWFRSTIEAGHFAVGEYIIGRINNMPGLATGYPIRSESGQVTAIVSALIDLKWLKQMVSMIPLPADSVMEIIDVDGKVLLREPDLSGQWIGKPAPEMLTNIERISTRCWGDTEVRGHDGILRLSAIEPLHRIHGDCAYVRVGLSKKRLYRSIDKRLWRYLMAISLFVFLIIVMTWIGSERLITHRFRVLISAAQCLGKGDFSARANLSDRRDEIGQLGVTFDAMAEEIESREKLMIEKDRALKSANRALRVLSAGNRAMFRATNEQSLLNEICRNVVEQAGYPITWVGYSQSEQQIQPVASYGVDIDNIDPRCLDFDPNVLNKVSPGLAAHKGEAVVMRASDTHWRSFQCMIHSDCRAMLSLPLISGKEVFGVFCIYSQDESDAFDPSEVALLEEAAADLAYGIGRLRDQMRRREAESANKIKSEFLANMSHELRTPLNAIIGFSDVIKDGLLGELTQRQKEYITDIYQSGQHLLSLINDILDLSKIEAGKMSLDLEAVSVEELVETSLSVIREKATAHRIKLHCCIEDNLPMIDLDQRKTKQILYNLLSNATKFSADHTQVTLTVQRVGVFEIKNWHSERTTAICLALPEGDFKEFLALSVEDQGIGIQCDDAPRLFQPFSQIDASLARQYEGTGLGLVMVMRMAALHGGTVAVSSDPGQGSCFTVWLPWRRSLSISRQSQVDHISADQGAEPGLVLIVEDNDEAAELECLQLQSVGMNVLRVSCAEEALALLGSRHPMLIVLDILLPGMDGWEFLIQIKREHSPWRYVPVVIASVAVDNNKGFALGAAQILQKPIARSELDALVQRIDTNLGDVCEKKVLIIDDDARSVEIFAAYLSGSGYRALGAQTARAGIDLAGEELPDLILLDLMMSDMSGFDVVDALRVNATTARIPIVVVTAKQLTAKDRAALNGHVNAILQKTTFNHERFIGEVKRALVQKDMNADE
jgi:signal transduction histidine kinase/CheY-like chemotaxis protein/HAMP domain-containing protein